jgi:hypothetical protein
MEDEKQRCGFCARRRFQRKIGFDLFDEEGQHLDALGRCSLERFSWKTLCVRQIVKDCSSIHRGRSRSEFKIGSMNRTVALDRFNLESGS